MVPKEILLISDPKIWAVPIQENNDPFVDVRNIPAIKVEYREEDIPNEYFLVRNTVAEKLVAAAKLLPPGVTFLLTEGYRPHHLQKKYFDAYIRGVTNVHPEWSTEEKYVEASKFIAPPENTPPHSTGGAVDITLVGIDGSTIDMGTPVDTDPETSNEACYTLSDTISAEARKNRDILITTLSSVGFVNYPTEWWHWSWGDKHWAYQMHEPFALYGSRIEKPII